MNKNIVYGIIFLALCGVAYFILKQDKNTGTLKTELKDFAVKDTTSIDKIFLASKSNQTVLLERQANGLWQVNGKFFARPDFVQSLLEAIGRVEVMMPVPKLEQNGVMAQLATTGIKCEVYSKNIRLKTLYVGSSTNDNRGTYMMIENASMPFITYIPGWAGYLSARFNVVENEWKNAIIFQYAMKDLRQVSLNYTNEPKNSFIISVLATNQLTIKPMLPQTFSKIDTSALVKYLTQYAKVPAMSVIDGLKIIRDSIVNTAQPQLIIQITASNNSIQTLKIYKKRVQEEYIDVMNVNRSEMPEDSDAMYYHLVEKNEFGLIQNYGTGNRIYRTFGEFAR